MHTEASVAYFTGQFVFELTVNHPQTQPRAGVSWVTYTAWYLKPVAIKGRCLRGGDKAGPTWHVFSGRKMLEELTNNIYFPENREQYFPPITKFSIDWYCGTY